MARTISVAERRSFYEGRPRWVPLSKNATRRPLGRLASRSSQAYRLSDDSLPAMVPADRQTSRSTESDANRTDPSMNSTLTPPAWKLRAGTAANVGAPSFSSNEIRLWFNPAKTYPEGP